MAGSGCHLPLFLCPYLSFIFLAFTIMTDIETQITELQTHMIYVRHGIDDIKASLSKGDTKMDGLDLRLSSVEQTVNHPKTGLDATRDKVDGLNLKAAALGGVAGVLSALGLGGIGWLSGLLGPK